MNRTSDDIEGIGYSGFVSQLMLKSLKEAVDALAEQTIGDDPMACGQNTRPTPVRSVNQALSHD